MREGLATVQSSCHQSTQTHKFMLAWTHHAERSLLQRGDMQLWGAGKRGSKCLGMCLVRDEVCDNEVNSHLPFCPFRCTYVTKIRAEATSHGEWALKAISAALAMCKMPNGMSTYILADLPRQLHTNAEIPFVSSQLNTQIGQVGYHQGTGFNSFL